MQRFPTYDNLVENEDDLVGLVAYSLYKQDKFEFVSSHGETPPNDEQLAAFCQTSSLPNRIASYKDAAVTLLDRMNGDILEQAIDDIKRDYRDELEAQLKKIHPHSFGRNVFEHACAGLAVTAVLALVILVGHLTKNGLSQTASALFGIKVEFSRPAEPH